MSTPFDWKLSHCTEKTYTFLAAFLDDGRVRVLLSTGKSQLIPEPPCHGGALEVEEQGRFQLHLLTPPVIDGSVFVHEDPEAIKRAGREMLIACEDVGFFVLTHHGLCPGTILSGLRQFVDAGMQRFTKLTLASSTGLVKVSFSPPVHERVQLPIRLALLCDENDETKCFQDNVVSYFKQVDALAVMLLRTLLRALEADEEEISFGLEPDHLYSLLRGICYPKPVDGSQPIENEYSLEPHRDKSWLTVLSCSPTCDGLEFVDVDGVSYYKVPPGPPEWGEHPLIINVGDALQDFSRGKCLSRLHRARNLSTTTSRVSLPLFLEPHPDYWPTRATAVGPKTGQLAFTVSLEL
jgi:isopenicillin N synthase-like dioxygenase